MKRYLHTFLLSLLISVGAFGSDTISTHQLKPLGSSVHFKPSRFDFLKISPFLMTKSHPIYSKLIKFLKANRVTHNLETLKAAGFVNPQMRKWTHLVVTTHPEFPGYIFKIYTDDVGYYKDVPEWELWFKRCRGISLIREWIKAHHCEHLFCTPKKWILQLPEKPNAAKHSQSKYFILVEEDMNLLPSDENQQKWKSETVNKELLVHLHALLSTIGLVDCCKIDNIPFTKDGRIAFIDTQSFHRWPIRYFRLLDSLNEENRAFWEELNL